MKCLMNFFVANNEEKILAAILDGTVKYPAYCFIRSEDASTGKLAFIDQDNELKYVVSDASSETSQEIADLIDKLAVVDENITKLQLNVDNIEDDLSLMATQANLKGAIENTLLSAKSYTDDKISDLTDIVNESIIALSVVGTTVTYIKGDGTSYSFETQDNDTTYSLGTDEVSGLTKLYATTGSAEDGAMTQKAITTELDKKVGVAMDDSKDTLVFTIN